MAAEFVVGHVKGCGDLRTVMSDILFNEKCEILTLDNGKRAVFAKRNIKAGETILQEQPLLLWSSDGQKRCSNCYELTEQQCSCCLVSPLCVNCPQHNEYDCSKLHSMKDLNRRELLRFNETYGLIKCLLLRENPLTEVYFRQLVDNIHSAPANGKDKEPPKQRHQNYVQSVVDSGLCRHMRHSHELSQQLLLDLCSLLEVDSFEIRAPDGRSMSGFYLQAALLAHNCLSNTVISIDELYAMRIYASCDIPQNTEITHCYVNVLLGTEERRRLLKESKGLFCNCERCQDPTELGSHMSTLLCPECSQRSLPDAFLTELSSSVNQRPALKCGICGLQRNSQDINQELKQLQNDINHIQSLGGDVYQYEMLLVKYATVLHPQHYLMLDIKQNMAVVLRQILNDVSQCPGRYVYRRKMKLCEDILTVLRIIQPGISRLRAIALYELANTEAEYYRLLYQEKDLSKQQLIESLKETELHLRESIRMLLYEPKTTPEGQLTRSMLQELKYLQTDIKMLK